MEQLPIRLLMLHPDIQSRTQLDMIVIQEYSDLMRDGVRFPPVEVVRENGKNYVWDGFHRVQAAQSAELQAMWANVRNGTFADAQWLASGANKDHGLRRSNADKRRAVKMALLSDNALPDNERKSDRDIADHCSVSHTMVSGVRTELESRGKICHVASRKGKDNKTYTEINRTLEDVEQEWSQYAQEPEAEPLPFTDEPEPECEDWETEPEPSPEPEHKPTFNRTNENIEWAAWSWNPVTGCKHGCSYCYARNIARRFYPQGFEPTYHPDRLSAPINTNPIPPRWDGDRGHKGVFVCSMADLFGEWVPDAWIDSVMDVVWSTDQWTYIFLTKNPARYIGLEFPDHAWVGTTVDIQARVQPAVDAMAQVNARTKFLSCEPLLERLTFPTMDVFDWVIIGAQTKPDIQPEFEWVWHLTEQAGGPDKVFWKPNLTCRPMNYPKGP